MSENGLCMACDLRLRLVFILAEKKEGIRFVKSHNRTERDTQGVGRDILSPKKLFLELCGPCENSFRLPS